MSYSKGKSMGNFNYQFSRHVITVFEYDGIAKRNKAKASSLLLGYEYAAGGEPVTRSFKKRQKQVGSYLDTLTSQRTKRRIDQWKKTGKRGTANPLKQKLLRAEHAKRIGRPIALRNIRPIILFTQGNKWAA